MISENKTCGLKKNNVLIASNWIITTLGDITISSKGKKPLKLGQKSQTLNQPYINILAFEKGIYKQYTDGSGCELCNKDDVLIVWDGARCGLVGKGVVGAVGSTLAKLMHFGLNSAYLYYFLQTKYKEINKRPKGVGIPHIDPNVFWNIEFPLAPLPDQHRIVAKIDELFTKLDAGIEALKITKAQLKCYRQAVLKHAFGGKLTAEWREKHKDELEPAADLLEKIRERKRLTSQGNDKRPPIDKYAFLLKIPNEWSWTNFDEIGEVNPKFNRGEYSHDIDVTFLPMKNVTALTGQVNLSLRKKLSIVVKGYTYFTDGDILFSKITPCMENGKIVIVEKLCNGLGFGSTEFHVIRLSRELPRKLYFYYLIQEGFRREAKRNMTGAVGQLRVPTNYLKRVPVPFPILQEQQTIVEEINRRFSVSDKIEKTVDESLIQAERLRQSILKQAFEGKLVPQDPKDEPAEKLLERIKAEKAKHDNEKSSVRKWKRKTKQRRLL